jgi:hypothetical protein
MGAHTCNPVLGRQRQKDWEIKASLGYIGRPGSNQTKPNRLESSNYLAMLTEKHFLPQEKTIEKNK